MNLVFYIIYLIWFTRDGFRGHTRDLWKFNVIRIDLICHLYVGVGSIYLFIAFVSSVMKRLIITVWIIKKEVRWVVRNVGDHIVSYLYSVDIWFECLKSLSVWVIDSLCLYKGLLCYFWGFCQFILILITDILNLWETVIVVLCLILK